MRCQTLTAVAVLALLPLAQASAEEVVADASTRKGMEVVIYPGDLALIAEHRTVPVTKTTDRVSLPGAAALLDPSSLLIDMYPSGSATLMSKRFDGDVLSLSRLLTHNLGKEVSVIRNLVNTGPAKGQLLTSSDPALVRTERGVEIVNGDNLIFAETPPGVTAEPRLLAGINVTAPLPDAVPAEDSSETSKKKEKTDKEPAPLPTVDLGLGLSYLTGGFSWQATYVGRYEEGAGTLSLSTSAHLENHSGLDLSRARVRVVAGEVNRVRPAPKLFQPHVLMEMSARSADVAEAAPPPRMEVSGYHVYGPFQRVDLGHNESLDLTLYPTTEITVERKLLFEGATWRYLQPQRRNPAIERPQARLTFSNTSEDGFGAPLPRGQVRIYSKAPDGASLLLGEDRLDATAVGEQVALVLGRDFDVGAKRRQLSYDMQKQGRDRPRLHTSTHEIIFTNAKNKPVEVEARDVFGGDWEVLKSSLPFEKLDSQTLSWTVTIPAEGEVTLTYEIRVEQ